MKFLYKIFKKYQIFTQNIQNVIDLAHNIQKAFDFGQNIQIFFDVDPEYLSKLNFYAKYSKLSYLYTKHLKNI